MKRSKSSGKIEYPPRQKLATQDGVAVTPGDLIAMPGLGTWEVTALGPKLTLTRKRFPKRLRRLSTPRPSPMVRAILKMLGAS